jgi:hypothetical protein
MVKTPIIYYLHHPTGYFSPVCSCEGYAYTHPAAGPAASAYVPVLPGDHNPLAMALHIRILE